MRTYGRIQNEFGSKTWVEIDTQVNNDNSLIWVTTLIQTLKLNLGESPFFANYGIPARPSVIQQIAPDYYMIQTQKQFSQYFASLIISRQASPTINPNTPTYLINVLTFQGSKYVINIAGNNVNVTTSRQVPT
jgi:hypothetical protein